jgi:rubrerythrin
MEFPKTLTALEIAKIASDVESDGITFYTAAAAKAPGEDTEPVFRHLAAQEQEHLNTFRGLYRDLEGGASAGESSAEMLFDDELTAYLRVLSEGMFFPEGQDAESWIREQDDLIEVIRFAMKVETATILFYTEMASHNAFADSQELLTKIIAEERKHLVSLGDLLKRVVL